MGSLANYVNDFYSQNPSRIFARHPFLWNEHQPTLVKGETGRVLIFHGSFNPPHLGHLKLLTHTFDHGGKDLNIIAAIISPSEDAALRTKVKRHGNGVLKEFEVHCSKGFEGQNGICDTAVPTSDLEDEPMNDCGEDHQSKGLDSQGETAGTTVPAPEIEDESTNARREQEGDGQGETAEGAVAASKPEDEPMDDCGEDHGSKDLDT